MDRPDTDRPELYEAPRISDVDPARDVEFAVRPGADGSIPAKG